MKKLKTIFILLASLLLFNCNNGTSPEVPDNKPIEPETFSTTKVFNPTNSKIKLLSEATNRSAESTDVICELDPKEAKDIELGSQHKYYFTDSEGNKIADLDKSDSGHYLPVYLELNEPKEGKEYLLLNQYKNSNVLEKYPNYNNQDTYNILLYEVVEENDLDATPYYYNDEVIYIRIYPSANYWIDSKGYASNKLGTKITYNEEFYNNFESLSNPWTAWGWSTFNEEHNLWFCHRVTSSILRPKDADSYEVKDITESQSASHISVQNVPNGIEVRIVKKENDPEWTYSTIKFKEDEKDLNWYYSYFNNNECVLEKTNNILTFLYPFTTKGKTYTFTIAPFAGCVETVSIVADYTSPSQIDNLEILENFSVSYEEKDDENGPKRIIKINSNPLSLFDNKDIIKYKQLCVNTYNANYEWVYNFGHNDSQYNALLNDGIDFMNENSGLYISKTQEEFKNLLNKGNKIIIIPHIQFNTRPYSETSGSFLFTFERKEFSYTKIN